MAIPDKSIFDPGMFELTALRDRDRRRTHKEVMMESLKCRFPDLWHRTLRESRDIHQHYERLTQAILEHTNFSQSDIDRERVRTDSMDTIGSMFQEEVARMSGDMPEPPTPKVTFKQDDLLLLLPTP